MSLAGKPRKIYSAEFRAKVAHTIANIRSVGALLQ